MSSDPHVGRLLLAAKRRFDEELTRALHDAGYPEIRLAHSAVFPHLDADGTRPSVLAQRAGTTKQSMGELVADLEELGYVERKPDPSDGRAKVVVLTEAGGRLDQLAGRLVREVEEHMREELGERAFAQMTRALRVVGQRQTQMRQAPNAPSTARLGHKGRPHRGDARSA